MDRIRQKVRNRYIILHNEEPPEDFLSDFAFYTTKSDMPEGKHVISARRLRHLGKGRVRIHPAIMDNVLREGDHNIIDIGCGAGDDTRWFVDNGYGKATGLEKNISNTELGFEFYRDRKTSPLFVIGDALNPPDELTKNRFDVVYTGSMIHGLDSIDNVYDFIEKTRSMITPDGIFFGNTLGAEKREYASTTLQITKKELGSALSTTYNVTDFQVLYLDLDGNNCKYRIFFTALPK